MSLQKQTHTPQSQAPSLLEGERAATLHDSYADRSAEQRIGTSKPAIPGMEATPTSLDLAGKRAQSILLGATREGLGLEKNQTLGSLLLAEANERLEILRERGHTRKPLKELPVLEKDFDTCRMSMAQESAFPNTKEGIAQELRAQANFLGLLEKLRELTKEQKAVSSYLNGPQGRRSNFSEREPVGDLKHEVPEIRLLAACQVAFAQIDSKIPATDETGKWIRSKRDLLKVSIPNIGGEQEIDLLSLRIKVTQLLLDQGALSLEEGRICPLTPLPHSSTAA